ncbi:MAG TPA: FAD-dependent oxidoreductase, partial [Rubrobacter sp.]|nr:FAD-dependent oxidoreductase [Rubrobacter sp.]
MFEVVVIGGGPSGVIAALRARELGATVALIEREHLGGVSTNDGCVPTRVLAKAARLMRDAEQFADYGLEGGPPKVDFVRLLNRTEHIVETVHQKKQLRAHLEAADVRLFDGIGDARFLDGHTLSLGNGSSVQGEKFILCVGGHARRIPLPGGELALTHSDVWTMDGLPESVVVVGGAATGCQLASVFAAFGSRVTLLEVSPRILAAEDEMVSEAVADAFVRRGIEIVTGIGGVDKVERENGRLSLFYPKNDEAHTLAAETVMFAVGWPGNVEGLNLEAVGVET